MSNFAMKNREKNGEKLGFSPFLWFNKSIVFFYIIYIKF